MKQSHLAVLLSSSAALLTTVSLAAAEPTMDGYHSALSSFENISSNGKFAIGFDAEIGRILQDIDGSHVIVPDGFQANGVANDGSVVGLHNADNRAARWNPDGTMVALMGCGSLTQCSSYAEAVSADGEVTVGGAYGSGENVALEWDGTGNATELFDGHAYAISSNGRYVLGHGIGEGVIFDRQERILEASISEDMAAYDIANTGRIVGFMMDSAGPGGPGHHYRSAAYRDLSGNVTAIDIADRDDSNARAVSDNGDIIVGSAGSADLRSRGFVHDVNTGETTIIGTFMEDGSGYSHAMDVSGDGTIVVGDATALRDNGSEGYRAFVYRTNTASLLDLENSQRSILNANADLNSVAMREHAALDWQLGREIALDAPSYPAGAFGFMPLDTTRHAIRIDGGLSRDGDETRQNYVGLSAAVGDQHFTFGGFLGRANQTEKHGQMSVDGDHTRAGSYLRYRENGDLGLTWKTGLGLTTGDAEIVRQSDASGTEEGRGTSSIAGSIVSFSAGYGLQDGDYTVTPSFALSHSNTKRAGYTEQDTAAFPATFDDHVTKLTTLDVALSVKRTFGQNTYTLEGGVEFDLSRSNNPMTGTSEMPGMENFSIDGPTVKDKARLHLALGTEYKIDQNRTFSVKAGLRETAFSNDIGVHGSAGYTWRF